MNTIKNNGNQFFIMRHVESIHNVDGWISADEKTDKKSQLTEVGIQQAHKIGKELQTKNITIIYHSPFQRVIKTCEIINNYLNVPTIIDKRLVQYNCGIFNGKLWQERDAFYQNNLEKLTKAPPNGENFLDVKKRMVAFLIDINNNHIGENLLIISHGNPLRILQWATLNLPNANLFADMRVLKWKSNISPEPKCEILLFNRK
ncbi:MAG: histidine phosphatase family protein [Patescibacteria group bacterium]